MITLLRPLLRACTPLAIVLAALPVPGTAQPQASPVVKTDEVRAELVAHAPEGLGPGKPAWLGLLIEHKPHWHTYWKNPGDSGLPTSLNWTLPAGAAAGDIAWPTPSRLPVGPLMNFGYEGRVLLPVPLTLAPAFQSSTLDVRVSAQWLVCKDICIPQQGEFRLSLPTQGSTATHAAAFAAADAARPRDLAGAQARAELVDAARVLRVSVAPLPASMQGRELAFFPEVAGVLHHAAKVAGRWDGARWQADLPVSPQRYESPARLAAVLVAPGQAAGVRVELPIQGAWPAPAAPGSEATAAVTAAPPAPVDLGLGIALLFAFVGGALLNLMPCVFPILSLKVLGFAGHAHSRRALAGGGLAYGIGVVASFLALAGLLIALRAGGEQIGWGFQLQAPGFVAALAVLFTLIALNLAGLFEFATLLPSGAAGLRLRHPLADSFLTGVLAVAVASPCTAPFMGAALGVAFTLPATQTLALFAALGLGMALPYVLASLWPGVARALPRPGPWMATFKTVMAFPMLATVVWLVWVLGQQTGIDGAAALLGVLVALAFALWAWGRVDSAPASRRAWNAVGLLLLGAAVAWAVPSWREARAASEAPGARWEAWSAERVAALNAEGRSVFVDFTAAWCVTCQVNKRTTLGNAGLLADFDQRNVVLMRADWTRRDAAISRELTRLGRNGVPVYALYRPGQAQPTLLPELLSVAAVRAALQAP
ncbi:MAG TPA: thioredoxin family protein [Burkholderiaceae bacterium]|nr:thioredoxin family protein [Burkholderiaceae bacterium]